MRLSGIGCQTLRKLKVKQAFSIPKGRLTMPLQNRFFPA